MAGLSNVDDTETEIKDQEQMDEPGPVIDVEDPIEAWQHQITLQDLRTSQDTIEQIWTYAFEHEQMQWTKDELDSFCNPPQEMWAIDNPDFKLSLQIYLALSALFWGDLWSNLTDYQGTFSWQ
jgi:hypothetical protein